MSSALVWSGLLFVAALTQTAPGQIPEAVKAEANAEKRYALALDAAGRAMDEARAALGQGEDVVVVEKAAAAAALVEYVLESLVAMGKHPSQNGRNYKRAELRTRELQRRMAALAKDGGIEQREALQAAQGRVSRVHDQLLEGVMSKKP